MNANYQLFPELVSNDIQHLFTLRQTNISTTPETLPYLLRACEFPSNNIVQAEQTHGNQVAIINETHYNQTIPTVDALVTNTPQLTLVIRTADCGPLFFYDPEKQVIALAHSGRKGTEQNILAETVNQMNAHFNCKMKDILCVLGPCIRPPHYEIDIAQTMADQAHEIGLIQFYDCEENTGSDLTRFYSYRVEKGQTQRHFAIIRLK